MVEQRQKSHLKSIGLLFLVLLFLLYLAVAFGHAYLAPLTTGPDELAHYEYVRFIADHGRLPQTYQERGEASYKSDQPPLYHLIAALPAALIDPNGPPFLKRVYDHPRRQLIERTRHSWGLYNTEDELWPYRAEVLRWQTGRWLAILLGLGSVILTFFIAREVFKKVLPAFGFYPALGAAMVVAFIPRFTLTGSMLNYETTVLFFASLYLWVLIRLAMSPRKRWWYFAFLGLFMGLAITAKLSAIILLLETVVVLWLVEKYTVRSSSLIIPWLRHLLLTFVSAGIALMLWFGFVVYHFNTVADDGWYVGLLRPLIAADASDATTNRLLNFLTGGEAGFTGAIENLDSGPPWEWVVTVFRTFWVAEIEAYVPLGWVGLTVMLGVCLLAAYGFFAAWRRSRQRPADDRTPNSLPRLLFLLLSIHLLVPLVLPLIRYVVTSSLADTAQGRHILFLAAPAFAILLIWGVVVAALRLVKSRPAAQYIALFPGVFLLFWSIVQLWVMSWAYLTPLPVQTIPEAKAQAAEPLEQPFNEFVTLAGYSHQLDEETRMLQLDLIWQANTISPVDYLTEVTLVDAQGDVQREWLGHPANGRYPTRAWDAGDIVRDTVWLPVDGLAAGDYQLKLNLLPTNLGDSPDEEPRSLTTITLPDLPQSDGQNYRIWQNGKALDQPQPFHYRETILVTLDSTLAGEQPSLQFIHTDSAKTFLPVRQRANTALFMVGPDWGNGEYQLQVGENITPPLIQLIDRWERQFDSPPMQHLVEANFADQVKLLGYDLGANRAEPGEGVPLTLYWQGLDWMGSDYTIFTKLLAADQTVYGGRDRLPQEGYRTIYWAPDEIITDSFGVPVNLNAPDGVYTINVGLYQEVDGQAVSLPLMQDGQPMDVDSINIGPVKIGTTPPGFTSTTANPQTVLNQPFGDAPHLTLLGYDLVGEASELKLTLYWRSEVALPVDYTTFVHLRDAAGQTVAQKDQPPLNGAYPTSLWDSGEIIADEILIPLPADLAAGEYQLVIGMYDFVTGQRLSVPGNPNNEFTLPPLELNANDY